MNSRKLYLSSASACLIGIGAFFFLRELMWHGIALTISIISTFIAAAVLYQFASSLSSRAARAFVGLTLVFGAVCFGVLNDVLPIAVLWAGVLFGALDSLGKMIPGRRVEA